MLSLLYYRSGPSPINFKMQLLYFFLEMWSFRLSSFSKGKLFLLARRGETWNAKRRQSGWFYLCFSFRLYPKGSTSQNHQYGPLRVEFGHSVLTTWLFLLQSCFIYPKERTRNHRDLISSWVITEFITFQTKRMMHSYLPVHWGHWEWETGRDKAEVSVLARGRQINRLCYLNLA